MGDTPKSPALGAPVSTTMTSPGIRPPPKASAAPHASTAVAVAPPPAATPVTPVTLPPAATPPPAPAPTPKKSVLDIDIK